MPVFWRAFVRRYARPSLESFRRPTMTPRNEATNPVPLLPSALAYHDLGVSLIPTVANAKKGAVRWKRYQAQSADEATIRQWFTDTDNGNLGIGMVLGAVS